MLEKNNEINKKLVARHKAELESDLEKPKISNEEKGHIKHELDGLEKFGIDAMGSTTVLFNAGDIVKLTIEAGNKTIIRDAKILLFREEHIVFIDIKTNGLFQVLKYNVLMVDLLDIPEDDFNDYLNIDKSNWEKYHEQKGDKSYG